MNQAEYAARHGVSRKTVTTWKKRGWLVFTGEDIEADASDAMLAKYRRGGLSLADEGNTDLLPSDEVTENGHEVTTSRPFSSEAASDALKDIQAGMTIDEARLMKETYLARLAQLDYDQKSGRVVLAEEVAALVGTEYAKVRTKLLAIPAEQAPAIKRCRTTAEVQDKLTEILTRVLQELTADKPK